jgi:hypothetical protein
MRADAHTILSMAAENAGYEVHPRRDKYVTGRVVWTKNTSIAGPVQERIFRRI